VYDKSYWFKHFNNVILHTSAQLSPSEVKQLAIASCSSEVYSSAKPPSCDYRQPNNWILMLLDTSHITYWQPILLCKHFAIAQMLFYWMIPPPLLYRYLARSWTVRSEITINIVQCDGEEKHLVSVHCINTQFDVRQTDYLQGCSNMP
jgi:hypothetical protein